MPFHTTAGGLQRNKEQTESVARLRDGDRATECGGGGPQGLQAAQTALARGVLHGL